MSESPATSNGWNRAIVETADVDPRTLTANPLNWRLHPKQQLEALNGVLNEVGWVGRIIVNKQTGHIVDGHARVELAIEKSEATVPVDYVDLSPEAERLVLATLDPISQMAASDDEMLRALMDQCDEELRALNLTPMLEKYLPKPPPARK